MQVGVMLNFRVVLCYLLQKLMGSTLVLKNINEILFVCSNIKILKLQSWYGYISKILCD